MTATAIDDHITLVNFGLMRLRSTRLGADLNRRILRDKRKVVDLVDAPTVCFAPTHVTALAVEKSASCASDVKHVVHRLVFLRRDQEHTPCRVGSRADTNLFGDPPEKGVELRL